MTGLKQAHTGHLVVSERCVCAQHGLYADSVALFSPAGIFHVEHCPLSRWTDLSCQRVELLGE